MRFAPKQYAIFPAVLALLFNVFYVAHSGEPNDQQQRQQQRGNTATNIGYPTQNGGGSAYGYGAAGGTHYGTTGGGAGYYQQGGPQSSVYPPPPPQNYGGFPGGAVQQPGGALAQLTQYGMNHGAVPMPYPNPGAPLPQQSAYAPQPMPYGHFVPPPNNVHNPGYGPPQPTYPQAYGGVGAPPPPPMAGFPAMPGPYQQPVVPQPTPTIPPNRLCSPAETAKLLNQAMKGWGSNKDKIISAVVNCPNAGRQQVIHEYQRMYREDLLKRLSSELSFSFKALILALFKTPAQLDATELHAAMARIGTRENVLIEIMTTRSNAQIREIKQAYSQIYRGANLEKDIIGDTSFFFKNLLLALCKGNRDESWATNQQLAKQDAHALHKAGEARLGTDESKFIEILTTRNYLQLNLVFNEYKAIRGRTIEQAIQAEFSGLILKGLLAIVKSIQNRAAYFADLLYDSVKGMGTRDTDLIRLVVSRAEIDLADIRSAYMQLHHKTLVQAIEEDTSGFYRKCLLALVHGRYPY